MKPSVCIFLIAIFLSACAVKEKSAIGTYIKSFRNWNSVVRLNSDSSAKLISGSCIRIYEHYRWRQAGDTIIVYSPKDKMAESFDISIKKGIRVKIMDVDSTPVMITKVTAYWNNFNHFEYTDTGGTVVLDVYRKTDSIKINYLGLVRVFYPENGRNNNYAIRINNMRPFETKYLLKSNRLIGIEHKLTLKKVRQFP